ncbi:MAG: manganese efflux pump MntP family protein [Clostridiales bacterium]|nr:manganese efflux pump MntP family protein [Clostridiales bacterium]
MGLVEILLIAVGLSMDAFAVAICIGLTVEKPTLKRSLAVGLYFGIFQALMPLIGYLVAALFADMVIAYSHWIAFGLLCFLGGRMVWGGLKGDGSDGGSGRTDASSERTYGTGPAKMLPLAVATSIDAMAVGVSFAFLRVRIVPAVSLIGIVTLAISMVGVKVGSVFGARLRGKAELAGGVVLILIGLKILLDGVWG